MSQSPSISGYPSTPTGSLNILGYTTTPTLSLLCNSTAGSICTNNVEEILNKLNTEKIIVLLPVILFVAITAFVGLIGNALVFYIYNIRLRRSPSRFFIIFLAILDLISCLVGAGSELTDLLKPLVYKAPWACKILRTGLSFTIIAASFTLTCVAFDRYFKVCKPLVAFPVRKVKRLCVVVVFISVLLSSPALAIFGLKTVETKYKDISGTECSAADKVRGTALPIVYYIILFTAFLVLLTSFILLYIRIGLEIWKRKRLTIGETLPALTQEMDSRRSTRVENVTADDTSGPSTSFQTDEVSRADETHVFCDNPLISQSEPCSDANNRSTLNRCNSSVGRQFTLVRRRSKMGRMSIRTLRTTSIFFAVSVAFVLSFLPYLTANILKFTKIIFNDIHSHSEEVVYNLCVRSYFISNCINPIIYSALNRNFRKECKKLFKQILLKLGSICCRTKSLNLNTRK